MQQTQRANDSASLAVKFPKLKSLTVDLVYLDSDGLTKNGEMKYKVNVQHAKSLFSFVCPSSECLGGDFDLSTAVADAVAKRRKIAEGQIQCQGSRTLPKQQQPLPCHNILRYKLSLGYV
jgi:hypothetical protein